MPTSHDHTQTNHMMKITTLLLMGVLHFGLMYILMYAMVNILENVHSNLNQVYMAGIMTFSMLILEIALMGSMYENKTGVKILLGGSGLLFLLCFWFIRQQVAISDKEFLKSMISHHAGALLMCNKALIQDAEIKDLCQNILTSQQAEIEFMEKKLQELE